MENLSEKAKAAFLRVSAGAGDLTAKPKAYRRVAGAIIYRYGVNGLEFLIVKKPRRHNAWQFAQGGADKGETLLSAAKREAKAKRRHVDSSAGGFIQIFSSLLLLVSQRLWLQQQQ